MHTQVALCHRHGKSRQGAWPRAAGGATSPEVCSQRQSHPVSYTHPEPPHASGVTHTGSTMHPMKCPHHEHCMGAPGRWPPYRRPALSLGTDRMPFLPEIQTSQMCPQVPVLQQTSSSCCQHPCLSWVRAVCPSGGFPPRVTLDDCSKSLQASPRDLPTTHHPGPHAPPC